MKPHAIRLTDAEWAALYKAAVYLQTSRAEVVRLAVAEYLDRHGLRAVRKKG